MGLRQYQNSMFIGVTSTSGILRYIRGTWLKQAADSIAQSEPKEGGGERDGLPPTGSEPGGRRRRSDGPCQVLHDDQECGVGM